MSDKTIPKIDEIYLIRQTVDHWERMIAWAEEQGSSMISYAYGEHEMKVGIGEAWDSESCPLCKTYRTGQYKRPCPACPLFQKYGACGAEGVRNAYGALEGCRSWSDWATAARVFLEQIRSLLKEIDWTKPVRTIRNPHLVPQLVDQFTVYAIQTKEDLGNGCKARYFEYVDQYGRELFFVASGPQIIENVPEEPAYVPLKRGDRLNIDGQEYMVAWIVDRWALVNTISGTIWAPPVIPSYSYSPVVDLETLCSLLGEDRAGQWQEIYRTVRRRRG